MRGGTHFECSIKGAEAAGYERGRRDVQHLGYCRYTYRTAEQLFAWLAGWRRGQVALALTEQKRVEANRLALLRLFGNHSERAA